MDRKSALDSAAAALAAATEAAAVAETARKDAERIYVDAVREWRRAGGDRDYMGEVAGLVSVAVRA